MLEIGNKFFVIVIIVIVIIVIVIIVIVIIMGGCSGEPCLTRFEILL